MNRASAACLTAVATSLVVTVPDASAARWSSTTLTYRDTSPWTGSVQRAVTWINEMPGPIQLRRARSGRTADITIRKADRPWVDWSGLAEVSWISGRITTATIRLNADWYDGDGATQPTARAETAAHELLHAIGLPHAWGCSVMRPAGGSLAAPCNGVAEGELRCGPQRADAKALVARYGGRVRDWDGFRCEDELWDDDSDDALDDSGCPESEADQCSAYSRYGR